MCEEAWSRQMPIMLTGCSDEGLILYGGILTQQQFNFYHKKCVFLHLETVKSSSKLARLGKSFEKTTPQDLESDRTSENCKQIGAKIKHFYFGFTEPSLTTIDSYMKVNRYILIYF